MELFEAIRFDKHRREKSIRLISRERGVHRRMVRQALKSPVPPERKEVRRERPVLTDRLRAVASGWLEADRCAPRKQRHTARRVFQRLQREHGFVGAESTIRLFVASWRFENGLPGEAYVPLDQAPGAEAEVDWYEALVEFPSGPQKVQVFLMRACYSGREFHIAFPHQDQQAFLEAHARAFTAFGGVFPKIRYDNLKTAVSKVLRGRRRVESERFKRLRSHYLFESSFCRPGVAGAHEKGGVEGAVGRFRREHLVPVPKVADYDELNRLLCDCSLADEARQPRGRSRTIAEDWQIEKDLLAPLPREAYDSAEPVTARVDTKGRVSVKTNHYSVPIRLVGKRVEVRLTAREVEILHGGRVVARHERLRGRHGERLELDHYLELLIMKPGALERSRPLRHARDSGRWPEEFDRLWSELKKRYGEAKGAQHILTVVMLLRDHDGDFVHEAVGLALEWGACDAGAVQTLLRQLERTERQPEPLQELGELSRYDRPKASIADYDQLLSMALCLVSPLSLMLWGG